MTTSPRSTPGESSQHRVPLRILLGPPLASGPVDGAWWPQSRDLEREGADLVDHFPTGLGRIDRLLFSRPDWDASADATSIRRIRSARGVVKAGSFPGDDSHLVTAAMSSGRRLWLLVIPCETEPDLADSMMRQAADEANTQSPHALLGLAGPPA